jgi:hypothetical protein
MALTEYLGSVGELRSSQDTGELVAKIEMGRKYVKSIQTALLKTRIQGRKN